MRLHHPSMLKNIIHEKVCNSMTKKLEVFIDKLHSEVQRRTRFSFQRWKKEFHFSGSNIRAAVYLPFDTGNSASKVRYTANLYNNPYFEAKFPGKIHQPLQEALESLGIRCEPARGTPIKPTPWKEGAPNLGVRINIHDFVRILEGM